MPAARAPAELFGERLRAAKAMSDEAQPQPLAGAAPRTVLRDNSGQDSEESSARPEETLLERALREVRGLGARAHRMRRVG